VSGPVETISNPGNNQLRPGIKSFMVLLRRDV
jgi:hypothetical protein